MGLGPPPTLIEHCHMRFVIAGMPDQSSIRTYVQVIICTNENPHYFPFLKDLLKYNTRRLVRICSENCSDDDFREMGLDVENLFIADGSFPEHEIVDEWLSIVRRHFAQYPRGALAVHCRSGLGRSAILVAIALMETGMRNQEVIDLIRE